MKDHRFWTFSSGPFEESVVSLLEEIVVCCGMRSIGRFEAGHVCLYGSRDHGGHWKLFSSPVRIKARAAHVSIATRLLNILYYRLISRAIIRTISEG